MLHPDRHSSHRQLYEYDGGLLTVEVEQWVKQGRRKIAVHNTFVLYKWLEPYEKLAFRYGYRFQVIHCEGEHGSIHNVPEEMMQKWRETWEPYQKR